MPKGIFPKGFWVWPPAFFVALILPFVFTSDTFVTVAVLFGLYASINLMWTLVLGTGGIFSFATLGIVGVAGYTAAALGGGSRAGYDATKPEWPIWLNLLVATVVGVAAGAVVAAPAIRLRGVYFALFTIGLVQLCGTIVRQHTAELGGPLGLAGAQTFVPEDKFGTDAARYIDYFAALGLVIVALVVFFLVERGRLGLLLRTARESEPVARGMGIDVVRVRFGVFLVSSAMLGFAGGAYVLFYGGISPSIFGFNTLLLLFAMMVVGGIGSAPGVLVGTGLLLFVDQKFLESGAKRFIAIGILMFLITVLTNRGLAGIPAHIKRGWDRLGEPETAEEESAEPGVEAPTAGAAGVRS